MQEVIILLGILLVILVGPPVAIVWIIYRLVKSGDKNNSITGN